MGTGPASARRKRRDWLGMFSLSPNERQTDSVQIAGPGTCGRLLQCLACELSVFLESPKFPGGRALTERMSSEAHGPASHCPWPANSICQRAVATSVALVAQTFSGFDFKPMSG